MATGEEGGVDEILVKLANLYQVPDIPTDVPPPPPPPPESQPFARDVASFLLHEDVPDPREGETTVAW